MSARRAIASEAVVTRFIKAALKAGLKIGEFDVYADGEAVKILTHTASAPLPSTEQDEDAAWAGAKAKWRRSA